MVNAALLDCVNKAEKQRSQQRPMNPNELNNLKKVFDAASAMTAIVNQLPNNTETYNNFKDMHHDIPKKIASGDEPQQNKAKRDKVHKKRVLDDSEDNKKRVLDDSEDDEDDSDHQEKTLHLLDGEDSNDSDDKNDNKVKGSKEDDKYEDEDEDEDD
jgi:hypothetical protein